ncbi:MAG: hypothetical protein JKY94_17490 [Rhodobacteraceae bacterium]|nr:hypothetical protein [Paracoccaceae bacterium]
MPLKDPIFTRVVSALPTGNAEAVVGFIRTTAVAAGWIVDEYDIAPNINTEQGGDELYIRPTVGVIANAPRYSIKAFDGTAVDQQAIKVWMNTGYSANSRPDNQPGMYAQTKPVPNSAISQAAAFSGAWDTLPNANPSDLGMYLTTAWNAGSPLTGSVPKIPGNVASLHTYKTSSIDAIYGFYDNSGGGSSRCLIFIWYIGNTMYGLTMGHVLWDNEGTAPDTSEGHLLQVWGNVFGSAGGTGLPSPNSLGGSTVSSPGIIEVTRNRTNGAVTFPPGTPDGTPLISDSGAVVLQQGRIEASDEITGSRGSILRPDQRFDVTWNNQQSGLIPNPAVTIHREPIVGAMSQQRLGFVRPRNVSRFPDGGSIEGISTPDWSDSGFVFPIYYAPLMIQRDNDTVTEGSRQYAVYPGNRSGVSPWTQSWRVAGLAIRIG